MVQKETPTQQSRTPADECRGMLNLETGTGIVFESESGKRQRTLRELRKTEMWRKAKVLRNLSVFDLFLLVLHERGIRSKQEVEALYCRFVTYPKETILPPELSELADDVHFFTCGTCKKKIMQARFPIAFKPEDEGEEIRNYHCNVECFQEGSKAPVVIPTGKARHISSDIPCHIKGEAAHPVEDDVEVMQPPTQKVVDAAVATQRRTAQTPERTLTQSHPPKIKVDEDGFVIGSWNP